MRAGAAVGAVHRVQAAQVARQIAAIEALVGPCLEEFGYPLTTLADDRKSGLREKWMRAEYPFFLETKLALKIRTPLGRLVNLSALELADAAPQEDLST